ncbi:hypothetical protein D5086_020162 [Populus alba]|uniref:Uncharacterized protein n=1 Tax=Populus alba TaxID=43335 RepID=A0ACC4BKU7_POPAL
MAGEKIVGVAVDFSSCSRKALKWAADNIIRDGDHLVVIIVQPEGYYEDGEMQLWEVTGSPMIPLSEFSDPVTMKKYGLKPDPETLDLLNTVAHQKEIVVVLKIYWGDPREKICEAIDKIPLSCLVIGNRGLGKVKRAIMGSVSNYVVNNGSCPITVVKQSAHEPTFHFEAVRTSNQVPKRRAMDVEFDEDDNIDEEVRYLGRLEQKTKLSEVEQQLKKAEAAQRRRIQSKKAAREQNFALQTLSSTT